MILGLFTTVSGSDQRELAQWHAFHAGGEVLRIDGVSMEPRLMENDLVIVVPTPWSELKEGDMVRFFVNDDVRIEHQSLPTWIHQISFKRGDWIRTAGVNNPGLDPFWVNRSQVIGKVIAVYVGGAVVAQSVSERATAYLQSLKGQGNLARKD